ncbi:MAG: thioesterase family protein [Pseudomonadota bacterium]
MTVDSEKRSIIWDLPDPFTIELTVGDDDIDLYGHTNNAVYLSWCEQVAWAHSEALGIGWPEYDELQRGMAVRKTQIEYFAPSFANEQVYVANWIIEADGRLTATRRYQICRVNDGATLVRARSDFVCIDLKSGKPRRMPLIFAETYVVLPTVQAALEQE